jgi:hypothetical protein
VRGAIGRCLNIIGDFGKMAGQELFSKREEYHRGASIFF